MFAFESADYSMLVKESLTLKPVLLAMRTWGLKYSALVDAGDAEEQGSNEVRVM